MQAIKSYKKTFLTTGVGLLFLMFLLGFTELPWILSKPLLIKENIKKAPVIVVLYSGYGKIIRNGLDNYSLERVQKALQLWRGGFASHILFSGGGADRREDGSAGAKKMAREAMRYHIPQAPGIRHPEADAQGRVFPPAAKALLP